MNKITTTNAIMTTVFISSALLFSTQVLANNDKVSLSIGQPTTKSDPQNSTILIKKLATKDALLTSAPRVSGVERSQFITNKANSDKNTNAKANKQSAKFSDYQFSIFNAQSILLTDEDQDGYFQDFSVSFDVDYLRYDDFDSTTVYAELYLSRDGGPWLHYYTTEEFTVHSDDSGDGYEVITTLVDGYNSDNYNVLIDVYEVGYSDIVTTYSSDDSSDLYALPLESANYDIYYEEQVSYSEGHGGGSFSWLLLIPMLILSYRRIS
jgi:hypothetical protein